MKRNIVEPKSTDLKENNLIFVGRMHECKKVDELVKIFSKLIKFSPL